VKSNTKEKQGRPTWLSLCTAAEFFTDKDREAVANNRNEMDKSNI